MSQKSRDARKAQARRRNRLQGQASPRHRLRWMVRNGESYPVLAEDRMSGVSDVAESETDDRAEQVVADRLYGGTSMARLASRRKSQQKVLRRYDESANHLELLRKQTELFLEQTLVRGFDFEGFEKQPSHLRNNARSALRGMLDEFLSFRFSRPASIKSLDLLAQPVERLYAALDRHSRSAFLTFVTELEDCLNRMSRRKLLGSITYSGDRNENCQFTYFRAKAVCEVESTTKRVVDTKTTCPKMKGGQWWKENIHTIETLKQGMVTIQHVWHSHLLSRVDRTPVDHWRLPLPGRIEAVVETMPDFLKPYASIVTGELEFARIIARDLEYIPWEYRRSHEVVEEVRHYDPALLLGPWVLTGWCHQEQPSATRGQQMKAWLRHGRLRGLE